MVKSNIFLKIKGFKKPEKMIKSNISAKHKNFNEPEIRK